MELRLYSFVVFYLSSIQQGIQTQHLATQIGVDIDDAANHVGEARCAPHYTSDESAEAAYATWDAWRRDHKTTIVLNGGALQNVIDTSGLINDFAIRNSLPFGDFNEDEFSLGGIQTCTGIVLPAKFFNAKYIREYGDQPEGILINEGGESPSVYHNNTLITSSHPDFAFLKVLLNSSLAR